MKRAQIFQQYFWIINMLKAYDGLTFEELGRKWLEDQVAGGKVLQRSSFNRHRDAILDMFGVIIECAPKTYRYYISNPEILYDESIESWLYSTLAVHGVLADSTAVKERLVLENVPSGEEYLATILAGIKSNIRLRMGYQKFGQEGYVKTVCPYALKLFHRRWYLLALNDEDQMRIYALDRIRSLKLTKENFTMPSGFSPQRYFSEYFGVLTDGTPMAHVVLRAYGKTPAYLRTLPLHQSQRELLSNDGYTDFALDLRPTSDFLGQLLTHAAGIEVLEPADLRERMHRLINDALGRYQ